ncbi:hypothetical protein L9G16_04115 [Shewanella sp. A25]|nr:hypothetical protein [Shewanella shenzhenensis]
MSSLNRYLELQQRKFDKMQQRREQLKLQQELEQYRFEQLHEHLGEIRHDSCCQSLFMQNNSAIQMQLLELCEQQRQRVAQSKQDYQQQHSACMHQIGFNLGLERLLARREEEEQARLDAQEQKQLDELVSNYHFR